jgi:hypothetical protein
MNNNRELYRTAGKCQKLCRFSVSINREFQPNVRKTQT